MDLNSLIKRFRWFFQIRGIETDELPNAPTGWRTMIVECSRSKTYSGLLRNITGQLDFSGQAAYLLRREYTKYRLLARMIFTINMDTRQPYNTYTQIYSGKLDFAQKVDKQESFTVGAKNSDFSTNIDAYDSTPYSVSLSDGIYVQLPGLALNEIASLLPGLPPDGVLHSDYFPPINIVNNTQNSIAPSVQNVPYGQLRTPPFNVLTNWCFFCNKTGKLTLSNNITYTVTVFGGGHHLRLGLVDQAGITRLSIYDDTPPNGTYNLSFTFNHVLNVNFGDKLFLYVQQVDAESSNTGIAITGGQIDFSYQTTTPPTMCQALRGTQLFAKLLQAMNINQDSSPNLPVPYRSMLLNGILNDLVFTSSDSIRAAQGSIFNAGATLGPGVYKVISALPVTYGAVVYVTNQTFGFINGVTLFTGGTVQKIQSIFTGNVYNVGDTLQAGGTYLVEGTPDGTNYAVYNGIHYPIGQFFKYVLGQETYTVVDDTDTIFVKQVAVDPQIITSFADFFQAIKSEMGADCAFGVDPYTALDSSPGEVAHQLIGTPFIETLAYVYRPGAVSQDLGNLSKTWQSQSATDMQYNTIKVGQNDKQYNAINGQQEVSSTQYYTSALLAPVTELNLVSPYRYDPYGIEEVRITQNDTAASRSDNDTFGLWIQDTPVSETPFEYWTVKGAEALMRPLIGVDPSYYNYLASPKSKLLRGKNYLASIFWNMPGYRLTLSGNFKNIAMVYVLADGTRVSESDPVDLTSIGMPYFCPEYVTDTVSVQIVDGKQYSPVGFTLNGFKYKAFMIDAKVNQALGTPQSCKFLLVGDTDLSGMVR